MSDTVTSGAPAEAAAETTAPASEAAANGDSHATTPAFGTSRGSGLARGKRAASTPTASAAPAEAGRYQPTAVEIVSAPREYQNPFGGETVVPSPAEAPAPVQPVVSAAPAAPAPKPAAPEAVRDPAASELKILPPAETRNFAQSWENAPARKPAGDRPYQNGRPAFQPERRARSNQQNWHDRDGRSSHSANGRSESPRPQPAPAAPAPASGGFIGWLKGLFGGGANAAPAGQSTAAETRERPSHDNNYRRHRGGRNHRRPSSGDRNDRGYNQGRSRSDQPQHGDEFRGEHSPRRRHRGGRNRRRDDDRGPRAEGQQGGGAI